MATEGRERLPLLDVVARHPLFSAVTELGPTDWQVVGGTVRDAALGRESMDLDLSVADGGDELARRLAERVGGRPVVMGGDRWASYRVVFGRFQADIWDRRGGSLRADQERRDLTINSIAYDPATDDLLDPFGGMDDLGRRVLRATRADCFERDPQRVLRLTRFRLELGGFRIEEATRLAARAAAAGLDSIASERVREELERLLAFPDVERPLALLAELGALPVLLPNAPASLEDSARAFESLRKRLFTAIAREPSRDERLVGAVGLLLGSTGNRAAAEGLANDLRRRSLLTKKTLGLARELAAAPTPSTEDARRVFLLTFGANWPTAALLTALTGVRGDAPTPARSGVRFLDEIVATWRAHPELERGLAPLLDGNEIGALLRVPPGPAIGQALARLLEAQATGRVTTRAEARKLLTRRAATSPPSGAD